MSNYNSVTPEFIDELKTLLGEKYVKTDADTLDRYKTDEEADERCFHLPDVVVIPANAEEIAGVVKLCNPAVSVWSTAPSALLPTRAA